MSSRTVVDTFGGGGGGVGCFAVQKFALRCASLAELALTGLLKRKKSFPSLSLSLSCSLCLSVKHADSPPALCTLPNAHYLQGLPRLSLYSPLSLSLFLALFIQSRSTTRTRKKKTLLYFFFVHFSTCPPSSPLPPPFLHLLLLPLPCLEYAS